MSCSLSPTNSTSPTLLCHILVVLLQNVPRCFNWRCLSQESTSQAMMEIKKLQKGHHGRSAKFDVGNQPNEPEILRECVVDFLYCLFQFGEPWSLCKNKTSSSSFMYVDVLSLGEVNKPSVLLFLPLINKNKEVYPHMQTMYKDRTPGVPLCSRFHPVLCSPSPYKQKWIIAHLHISCLCLKIRQFLILLH